MTPAFFVLHSELPREGPGDPGDVRWAARLAGVGEDARILDAGCGPGGDIDALLAAAPRGHVHAVDRHGPFVEAACLRFADTPRVTVEAADMAGVAGPYDFIWSAGAVYFLGVEPALKAWRSVLAPRGAVAFTGPCHFAAEPSQGALAFWEGEGSVGHEADIASAVARAGYRVLGTRRLGTAAWEAYYGPMERRIAALRPGADADLAGVLDAGEREIRLWRAHRAETGYLLTVAVPA